MSEMNDVEITLGNNVYKSKTVIVKGILQVCEDTPRSHTNRGRRKIAISKTE